MAERARWRAAGLDTFVADEGAAIAATDLPKGCIGVESPVPGSLWKYLVDPGKRVAAGEQIAILESMKMEIPVASPIAGTLRECRAEPGRVVRAGDILAVVETD